MNGTPAEQKMVTEDKKQKLTAFKIKPMETYKIKGRQAHKPEPPTNDNTL